MERSIDSGDEAEGLPHLAGLVLVEALQHRLELRLLRGGAEVGELVGEGEALAALRNERGQHTGEKAGHDTAPGVDVDIGVNSSIALDAPDLDVRAL
jgi:hypothetical protein